MITGKDWNGFEKVDVTGGRGGIVTHCSATQPHWTLNRENFLEETKWLSEKSIHDITNFDNPSNTWCSCKKIPRGDTTICRFLQGIWQREGGVNTSSLWSPQRNHRSHNDKNTKGKVRLPDGDTGFFDIAADVLQGNTLAPYLFIIGLDYVLRTSIDGFTLVKGRSRR